MLTPIAAQNVVWLILGALEETQWARVLEMPRWISDPRLPLVTIIQVHRKPFSMSL
jgi:hypothetical protein